jgi:hypothetical protein
MSDKSCDNCKHYNEERHCFEYVGLCVYMSEWEQKVDK